MLVRISSRTKMRETSGLTEDDRSSWFETTRTPDGPKLTKISASGALLVILPAGRPILPPNL